MTTIKITWHAGDDYNNPEGIHLYGDAYPYEVCISKKVIRPGREWEWDVWVTRGVQRIDAPKSYRTLRDAKKEAQRIVSELEGGND